MNKREVFQLCKQVAPTYGIDPLLFTALIEQESSYMEDAARQEPGFHSKYTKPMNYSPVVETLLATSFGLTQMMGQSLSELGYFPSMDSVTVARMLDDYLRTPAEQVKQGCRWFFRKKRAAGGDERAGLLRWNGGGDPHYPDKVYARYERLKQEGDLQ